MWHYLNSLLVFGAHSAERRETIVNFQKIVGQRGHTNEKHVKVLAFLPIMRFWSPFPIQGCLIFVVKFSYQILDYSPVYLMVRRYH
jgi:hypothetical protein